MPKPKRGPQRPLTPDDFRDALSATSRDIVGHLTRTQGKFEQRMDKRFDLVDKRFDRVEDRLLRLETSVEAIKQATAVRQELQSLVRIPKRNGLTIDEAEIFVS